MSRVVQEIVLDGDKRSRVSRKEQSVDKSIFRSRSKPDFGYKEAVKRKTYTATRILNQVQRRCSSALHKARGGATTVDANIAVIAMGAFAAVLEKEAHSEDGDGLRHIKTTKETLVQMMSQQTGDWQVGIESLDGECERFRS